MRKGKQKLLSLLIALAAVLTLLPVNAQAEEDLGRILRVGLKYGSSAVSGANLLNEVGSGYYFGYYDSNLNFVTLAQTSQTEISMVKTQNLRYDGSNYVVNGTGAQVGCYHVGLPGSYADYASAQAAASLIENGFVAYIKGAYQLRSGNYASEAEATLAVQQLGIEGASVVGTSAYGISIVIRGTSTILFQFDSGDETGLGVRPDLSNNAYAKTWFAGYCYYGGFRYTRLAGGDLTVVNMVPLELYVRGVLPYEMSSSWHIEALKAQAVCARTYAVQSLNKHSAYGFDICNSTDCQVYQGTNLATSNSDAAVAATAGEYVWYGSSYAETFYFSSSGGATEDSCNVWDSNGDYPYLIGVMDIYETAYAANIPNYYYTVTFTPAQLQAIVQARGESCSAVVDFYVSAYTETGNVMSVTIVDSTGKQFTYTGERVRTLFSGVRSQRYTISSSGSSASASASGSKERGQYVNGGAYIDDASGTLAITRGGTSAILGSAAQGDASTVYTISGSGYGHNVGMSQYGAKAMAEQGFGYREIITFYFTGVRIGNA